MDSRILLISTYPELTKMAKEVSKELEVDLTIYEGGIMKNGHIYAKENENNYDVIISQGGTAAAIKNMISIPLISIEINIADILRALLKAKESGTKIGLISYRTDILEDLENIKKILDIEFEIFPYSNEEELKKQVEDALALNRFTLVGMGNCIVETAKNKNLSNILIKSSRRAIKQAIISARNIIALNKRDKERAKKLQVIIDYTEEGIIALDRDAIIETINPAAARILGIDNKDVLGYTINQSKHKEIFQSIYGDASYQIGELVKANKKQIISNRIPIFVNEERYGVVITIQEVSSLQRLEQKVRNKLYDNGLIAKYNFSDIKGESKEIKSTIEKAIKFGKTSTTILIEGETGSGKELFAQSIHNISIRKKGPFVAINCAALPENLLESELFGYEEGAFTGAKKGGKLGLFELAHRGTIFLDEIGEMPLSLQSRLLRVLQEKEVMRIGGEYILTIDVRIIAATNLDLDQLVAEGNFREDLYYRLNILNLKIPPIRERKEDIGIIARSFIEIIRKEHFTVVKDIKEEGIELLKEYNWLGNARELRNFVEKVVVLGENSIIEKDFIEELLEEHVRNKRSKVNQEVITDNHIIVKIGELKDMEHEIIQKMDEIFDEDKEILARRLGISRTTLWKRLKDFSENN